MKLGMNLFLWSGDATRDLIPTIKKLAKMGFDGIECPIFTQDESVYRDLRSVLDDVGMGATGCTVVPGEVGNPISPDASSRQKAIEYLRTQLRMAKILGCDVLCGPVAYPLGVFTGNPRTGDEWKWGVESMRIVGETADELGVTIAVECLNRFETYFLNTGADLKRFVQEVGVPRVRMMMDTFHSNIEEKDNYKAWKACGKTLAHVHISECDRGVPGSGHVQWKEVFRALKELKYDGWLTIESFGTTVPTIAAAAKIWRKLFPSNDHVARDGLKFMKKMLGRKK